MSVTQIVPTGANPRQYTLSERDRASLAQADVLGIPVGTAQSRLHRALETMRAAIDADERVELRTERESYA